MDFVFSRFSFTLQWWVLVFLEFTSRGPMMVEKNDLEHLSSRSFFFTWLGKGDCDSRSMEFQQSPHLHFLRRDDRVLVFLEFTYSGPMTVERKRPRAFIESFGFFYLIRGGRGWFTKHGIPTILHRIYLAKISIFNGQSKKIQWSCSARLGSVTSSLKFVD